METVRLFVHDTEHNIRVDGTQPRGTRVVDWLITPPTLGVLVAEQEQELYTAYADKDGVVWTYVASSDSMSKVRKAYVTPHAEAAQIRSLFGSAEQAIIYGNILLQRLDEVREVPRNTVLRVDTWAEVAKFLKERLYLNPKRTKLAEQGVEEIEALGTLLPEGQSYSTAQWMREKQYRIYGPDGGYKGLFVTPQASIAHAMQAVGIRVILNMETHKIKSAANEVRGVEDYLIGVVNHRSRSRIRPGFMLNQVPPAIVAIQGEENILGNMIAWERENPSELHQKLNKQIGAANNLDLDAYLAADLDEDGKLPRNLLLGAAAGTFEYPGVGLPKQINPAAPNFGVLGSVVTKMGKRARAANVSVMGFRVRCDQRMDPMTICVPKMPVGEYAIYRPPFAGAGSLAVVQNVRRPDPGNWVSESAMTSIAADADGDEVYITPNPYLIQAAQMIRAKWPITDVKKATLKEHGFEVAGRRVSPGEQLPNLIPMYFEGDWGLANMGTLAKVRSRLWLRGEVDLGIVAAAAMDVVLKSYKHNVKVSNDFYAMVDTALKYGRRWNPEDDDAETVDFLDVQGVDVVLTPVHWMDEKWIQPKSGAPAFLVTSDERCAEGAATLVNLCKGVYEWFDRNYEKWFSISPMKFPEIGNTAESTFNHLIRKHRESADKAQTILQNWEEAFAEREYKISQVGPKDFVARSGIYTEFRMLRDKLISELDEPGRMYIAAIGLLRMHNYQVRKRTSNPRDGLKEFLLPDMFREVVMEETVQIIAAALNRTDVIQSVLGMNEEEGEESGD